MLARTLSQGVQGLPDTAPALAAALRQTLARWGVAAGSPVQAAFLLGGGAAAQGADEYLAYELGVPVLPLPPLHFDSLTPDQAVLLPRFAKALGLALSVGGRARDLNLRQGELAFQRGYGFIKEKLPILAGLGAAIVISFFFSAWAESVSLSRENESLRAQLALQTSAAFGEEVEDPEEVLSALERLKKKAGDDPMPPMDALDIINEMSEVISMDIKHDIEEFDLHRGKVKVTGIVGSTDEAQGISSALEKHRCFDGAKLGKITQVVNGTRQKYSLEFDVDCNPKSKKKSSEGTDE
jgi:general secretion pathway protein L